MKTSNQLRQSIYTLFILAFLFALNVHSWASIPSNALDLKSISEIPIRDDGRVKPFESFAKSKLLRFSGKSTLYLQDSTGKRIGKEPALWWMLQVWFEPQKTRDYKIFLINDPRIATSLGLSAVENRLYSQNQLEKQVFKLQQQADMARKTIPKDQSASQKEFLRIESNLAHLQELQNILKFTLPDQAFQISDISLAQHLMLPGVGTYSFLDIYRKAALLGHFLDSLPAKPQNMWTNTDVSAFLLSKQLFEWSQFYQSSLGSLFPVRMHKDSTWLSPWEVLNNRMLHMPGFNDRTTWLVNMQTAFVQNKASEFNQNLIAYHNSIYSEKNPIWSEFKIKTEIWYNKLDPFFNSQILYGLILILTLVALNFKTNLLNRLATGILVPTILLHCAGVVARMIITGRPPVTALYETFLFVSAVCALMGLFYRFFYKSEIGLILSSFTGLVLLLISNKFAADGDTLQVLVAVLDSNFWLSTHVVAISLGYSGTLAAGVLGHIWAFQAIRKIPQEKLKNTYSAFIGTLAFSLILSFVGTVLGGVWADQSWGRFWGWDPKENGAFLIVLWTAVMYHARLSGWVHEAGMALLSMIGMIMVMLAWFGINLLGVGLHSYGFTSGLATGLFAYIGVQLVIVALTFYLLRKKGIRI